MKREKEWYTYDRCGKEISKTSRCTFAKRMYRIDGRLSNELKHFSNEFIYKTVLGIDLCPKCRKDFERFMSNENINTKNSAKSG